MFLNRNILLLLINVVVNGGNVVVLGFDVVVIGRSVTVVEVRFSPILTASRVTKTTAADSSIAASKIMMTIFFVHFRERKCTLH